MKRSVKVTGLFILFMLCMSLAKAQVRVFVNITPVVPACRPNVVVVPAPRPAPVVYVPANVCHVNCNIHHAHVYNNHHHGHVNYNHHGSDYHNHHGNGHYNKSGYNNHNQGQGNRGNQKNSNNRRR